MDLDNQLADLKFDCRRQINDFIKLRKFSPAQLQEILGAELYSKLSRAMLGNCSILNVIKIMLQLGLRISIQSSYIEDAE